MMNNINIGTQILKKNKPNLHKNIEMHLKMK